MTFLTSMPYTLLHNPVSISLTPDDQMPDNLVWKTVLASQQSTDPTIRMMGLFINLILTMNYPAIPIGPKLLSLLYGERIPDSLRQAVIGKLLRERIIKKVIPGDRVAHRSTLYEITDPDVLALLTDKETRKAAIYTDFKAHWNLEAEGDSSEQVAMNESLPVAVPPVIPSNPTSNIPLERARMPQDETSSVPRGSIAKVSSAPSTGHPNSSVDPSRWRSKTCTFNGCSENSVQSGFCADHFNEHKLLRTEASKLFQRMN